MHAARPLQTHAADLRWSDRKRGTTGTGREIGNSRAVGKRLDVGKNDRQLLNKSVIMKYIFKSVFLALNHK